MVIYNCNLINRADQTVGFDVEDYVKIINKYLGGNRIDAVTIQKEPKKAKMKDLCVDTQDLVSYNRKKRKNREYAIFEFDLLDKDCVNRSKADAIAYLRSPVRHDGEKVGRAVIEIYNKLRK